MAIKITRDEFTNKFGITPEEVKEPTGYSLGETVQDIKQVGSEIVGSAKQRSANVGASWEAYKQGKQGLLPTVGQFIGQSAGLGSDVIGSVFKGGVKAVLPQSTETAAKEFIGSAARPIVESDVIQNIRQRYEALDPVQKRNIDATLGIGSLLFDVATMGAGGAGAKTAGKVALKTGATTAERTGGILKKAGQASYGMTIVPEAKTVEKLFAYDVKQPSLWGRVKNLVKGEGVGLKPTTEAETAAKYGLMGTEYQIGVQAGKATEGLWKSIIQPKLQAVKGKINFKTFLSEIEKEVPKISDLTRRKGLMDALNKVKEDYKKVGNITLEKLQDYKEGWAEFLPDAVYKGQPIANSLKEIHNLMAQKARSAIYKYVGPEGQQAYIDYSNLQSIIKAAKKSRLGDPTTRSISRNAWEFIMNKAITPIVTIGGQVLYRTGEGLEFIGKAGAKKIKDIIGK